MEQKNIAELIILIIIGIMLSVLYKFDFREMFKLILTWGFALTGYDLFKGNIKQITDSQNKSQ